MPWGFSALNTHPSLCRNRFSEGLVSLGGTEGGCALGFIEENSHVLKYIEHVSGLAFSGSWGKDKSQTFNC